MNLVERSSACLAGAVVMVAALSACVPFVPTRPNAAPMQIGVDGGEVRFRWCGEPTEVFAFLDVTFRVMEPRGEFTNAFSGTGSFRFETGDPFSAASPPEGVTGASGAGVPTSDDLTYIFLTSGASESERNGVDATFHVQDLSALRDDEWLTTSGDLVEGDCGS